MSLSLKESRRESKRAERNPKSRPGAKVDFQFINVQVEPNVQGKKAKAEERSIIRGNAAHFHWRHNRPPKAVCEPNRSEKSAGVSPPIRSKRSSKVSDMGDTHQPDSLQLMNEYSKHQGQLYQYVTIEKNTELGFNIDPFSSCPSELPGDFVSRCISFNATVILPELFPDGGSNLAIRTSMLQHTVSNACMLHAFIVGAVIRSYDSLGVKEIPPGLAFSLFQSRAKVIQQLNVVLRNPKEASRDINIFAVAALAKDGQFDKAPRSQKFPRQGPLQSLQCLSSFATIDFNPIHFEGMSTLLKLRGGLHKVELPGLASLISFGELRIATRRLFAPRFPMVTLSCPIDEFIFETHEQGFGEDECLVRVTSLLKSYTSMIEDFCEGRKVVTASVLIDHRNTAQHALLSLTPGTGNYECYRLASLIFALLVTFPLPYVAAPFRRLATELSKALNEWDDGDQMLIWVLTMGAIGSIGLDERVWFLSRFRLATSRVGVNSWSETKGILKRYLWLEATNDSDGYDVWLDSKL